MMTPNLIILESIQQFIFGITQVVITSYSIHYTKLYDLNQCRPIPHATQLIQEIKNNNQKK